MTDRLDLERVVTDWLHEGATTAGSGRVLAAALVRAAAEDQEGGPALRPVLRAVIGRAGDETRFGPVAVRGVSRFAGLSLAAAAVLILVVAGVGMLPRSGGNGTGAIPGSPLPSGSQPTPPPSLSPRSTVDPRPEHPAVGTHRLEADGIRFSVDIPPRWEGFGPHWSGPDIATYVSRDILGPQGAEAVIFFTRYPDGANADPCGNLPDPPGGLSATELATAVSAVPGVDLIREPTDVTVDGRVAFHVAFTVREDVGCDPGFVYWWSNVSGGALWPQYWLGDTFRVWVVEVDGTILFIEAGTHNRGLIPDGTADEKLPAATMDKLETEIQQVIESIRFE